MNFGMFSNIQWILLILFYECSNGYKETEAAVPEVFRQQRRHGNELQNEWSQVAESQPTSKQQQQQQGLNEIRNAKSVLPSKNTSITEEHYHYEISPRLENELKDRFPSRFGHNASIGFGERNVQRKGHQNNAGQQQGDDYDYDEFANHHHHHRQHQHHQSAGSGIVTAEIDDMEDACMNDDAVMSSLSIDDDSGKIIPLGKQRRKLLFTGEEPIVSGFSDEGGTEPDYDDNKHRRTAGSALWMKGNKDRSTIDDELADTGGDGNDYNQQLGGGGDSYGDISGHASPIVVKSNKAYYRRNRRTAFDGRKEDNAVARSRKSAKVEEGVSDDPSDSSSEESTTKATVYHQHYDDSDNLEGVDSTKCNCTLICAKEKVATDEQLDADEESTTSTVEPKTDKPEEEVNKEKIDEKEDINKEDTEYTGEDAEGDNAEDEYIPEDEDVEEGKGAKVGGKGQRELYIDLTIGIRNMGNASLSEGEEPVEFHKKIIVKRDTTPRKSNRKQSTITSPAELIKAIYQLVDNNDSLRTHVAPRLPDRSKLLSKLEQENHRSGTSSFSRKKINDRHRRPNRGSGTVNRIEDNQNNGKAIADVMEAIGQLLRQRD